MVARKTPEEQALWSERYREATFREKLADWISGGALTKLEGRRQGLEIERNAARMSLELAWKSNRERQARLDRIAAQETPNANATVRRMARIARGEE